MDNAKVYKRNIAVRTAASESAELLLDILSYICYAIGYVLHSGISPRVKTAAGKAVRIFNKYIAVWVAAFGIYLLIGIVGGLEAGLISFAVGVPCCLILLILGALASKED